MEAIFRSVLPELKVYDQLMMQTLNRCLSASEKQMFFYLSERYTKGITAARANRLIESSFYFRENGSLNLLYGFSDMLNLLTEKVYLSAKSYQLFKLRKKDEAMAMVDEVLKKSGLLQSLGFSFLLFNDIQQYHNLGRIHIAYEDHDMAFLIAQNLLIFLMTCKGCDFKLGFMPDIDTSVDGYQQLRNLMTIQVLTWLLSEIQKVSLKYDITAQISMLFRVIRKELKSFVCNNEADLNMFTYLSVLLSFTKGASDFKQKSTLYISSHDELFFGSNQHLEALIELSQK
ncbi:hypothetical protein MTO98_07225 [Mucilaginibacter sp. SMC90]|uniref:hypothetical protein n=1 Tax=Mucilaginibacter sp. SMC90 TaxID=2929803 RepID=UPI001FB4B5A8|nr:hypothetical protein [Mucilaginibacter sp. SMC90]UOE50867.1 hypothetical protein MTO98_07225 [Mucilaginibacter sp. SMC90]